MKLKLAKHQDNLVYITLHAKEIFHRLRWPNGAVCPYCGHPHIWHYRDGSYKCAHCHKRFTDTSNTIFHSTKVQLSYWLIAIYLITMGKGISSQELSDYLGINQKTAWYMLHKIRYAFKQDGTILTGDVAVDEVYLGGKWSSIIIPKKIDILKRYGLWHEGDVKRTWHKRNICRAISEYKQPVYGMNDGHRIVLQALPNRFNSQDLLDITLAHTGNLEHLISDQSSLYRDIKEQGFDVIQMNHSKGEFSNMGYSSNRIEGTFSHLKRRYRHAYVRPNKKYIQLYLNEFAFRWNYRDTETIDRLADGLALCVTRGRVTRKDIDLYTWKDRFVQRGKKHYECVEDLSDFGSLPGFINTVTIDGLTYTRDEIDARIKSKLDYREDLVTFVTNCQYIMWAAHVCVACLTVNMHHRYCDKGIARTCCEYIYGVY